MGSKNKHFERPILKVAGRIARKRMMEEGDDEEEDYRGGEDPLVKGEDESRMSQERARADIEPKSVIRINQQR